jgi:hypothetical protein
MRPVSIDKAHRRSIARESLVQFPFCWLYLLSCPCLHWGGGSFQLTTNTPDDGALPGNHKVIVMEVGRPPLGGPDSSLIAPGVMDPKFYDFSTSDLTATVKPERNEITLTVERNPPR